MKAIACLLLIGLVLSGPVIEKPQANSIDIERILEIAKCYAERANPIVEKSLHFAVLLVLGYTDELIKTAQEIIEMGEELYDICVNSNHSFRQLVEEYNKHDYTKAPRGPLLFNKEGQDINSELSQCIIKHFPIYKDCLTVNKYNLGWMIKCYRAQGAGTILCEEEGIVKK